MKLEVKAWTDVTVTDEHSSGSVSLRFGKDGLQGFSSCGGFAPPVILDVLGDVVRAIWEIAYEAGKAASK